MICRVPVDTASVEVTVVPRFLKNSVVEIVVPRLPSEVNETLLSPPAPDGVAHVASPRQKVVAPAPVPLLRFATGRLPVACATGMLVQFVNAPDAGVPSAGATKVLLLMVCAFVLNVNSSTTLAKSGMVSVVAPTV